MLAYDYAKALHISIADGMTAPKALERLDALLAEKGHERLRPRILRTLHTLLETHEKVMTPVVTVANERDVNALTPKVTAILKEMDISRHPIFKEDQHLIGGFVIDQGDKKIDRSYKTVLTALYRNIIRN